MSRKRNSTFVLDSFSVMNHIPSDGSDSKSSGKANGNKLNDLVNEFNTKAVLDYSRSPNDLCPSFKQVPQGNKDSS